MNLAHRDQGPRLLADGGAELAQERRSVAFDGAAGIVFGESEVERVSPVGAGKSADSRAESVNQPWNASKGFRTKNSRARFFVSLDGHHDILNRRVNKPLLESLVKQLFCQKQLHIQYASFIFSANLRIASSRD